VGQSVLYIPAYQETKPDVWEKIRMWQKDKGHAWERLRITPDFYLSPGIQRDEMQAMLDLVRNGLIDKVVYVSLSEKQTRDLDWLAFALSLQKYRIPVETLEDGVLDVSKKLHQLTSGFQSMHAPT
jgi:hypothetical protein